MNSPHFVTLASGHRLSGRYQIISQLGQGGFGRTFLAEDLYLPSQPKCVVKQLRPLATDPTTLQIARRLFDTEAQILHQLGMHPQIPQLFAYFEENQEFYLVQEYIEGETLDRELTSTQTKSEDDVIYFLLEILEILAFVHQQKVIHRDINPYNIIRRQKDRKLVLIDFGAVKQITTQIVQNKSTSFTIAIGTPGYIPSEQAIGTPQFSSDIYAAGIIAIQALTGRSPQQISIDSQTGEINWQSLVKVSPGLTNVLNTMVCYDFRQRYYSAIEALEAVKSLKTSGGGTLVVKRRKTRVSTRQNLTPIDAKKWIRKGSLALGIIGLGAALFVGVNHLLIANSAVEAYQQGNTLYELKNYDRALQAYEQALEIRPEYGDAWRGKGDVLQALGENQNAIASYEKAIQIEPKNWQAWTGRAQTLDKLGKSQEAIETFQGAIAINDKAEDAWLGLAQIQMRLKQYPEAINSFDRLLKIQSDNWFAWYQKGWALQNLREYREAIDAYDRAVEIKPDFSSAWYQKGNILMNLQKYQEAITAYEKAVQFQPKLYQAWYSFGIALSKSGRIEEALNAYSQATDVKSNYAEAWYQKGWMLHQLKRYDEAEKAYETALRFNPSNAQIWYNKGNVSYNQGNYDSAIAAYQQTVALKKDYSQAWNSLGNALLPLKRYQEAIDAYDRALRYQPDYKQAQENKKQAQYLLEKEQETLDRQNEEGDVQSDDTESPTGSSIKKKVRKIFNLDF